MAEYKPRLNNSYSAKKMR